MNEDKHTLNTAKIGLCLLLGLIALRPEHAHSQALNESPIRFPGDQVILSAPSDGQHAFVSASIGDTGPYSLIIDSGSSAGVLDAQLVKELGLEVVDQREVLSGGVDPIMLDVVLVPHMQVGEMEIINTEFLAAPLAEMSGGTSFGVIGMDIFSEVLVTFDIQGQQVVVSHGSLAAEDDGVYGLSGDSVLANFEIEIAQQSLPVHIDTGAPGGFTLPLSFADRLPLLGELRKSAIARMVGGTRETWLSQLDGEIVLGGMRFENPSITFLDPAPMSGNLGNAILRQFIITFDFANALVAFQPAASGTNSTQAQTLPNSNTGPRQLGIQFGGMGALDLSTIGSVMPGSLAEQSGLRAADVIVRLNDRPMSNYEMSELRELFSGSEALSFEVERAGSPMSFTIE